MSRLFIVCHDNGDNDNLLISLNTIVENIVKNEHRVGARENEKWSFIAGLHTGCT